MKRLLLCLLLICLLPSCSGNVSKTKTEINPTMVNAVVQIDYLGEKYSAVVDYNTDGGFEIVMTSPNELSGITVSGGKGGTKLRFGDVSLDYSDKRIAEICPFFKFRQLLDSVKTATPGKIIKDAESFTTEFSDSANTFKVTADKESGLITYVEIKNFRFEIVSNEVT